MIDYAALARTTLPALLVERARRAPGAVAFRAKARGIYRETTWRELADRVAAVALALQGRGLRRGDTGAIMGNACPEWTLAYLLRHGGARLLVAEDQEHLDRALAVADGCPSLGAIVVIDTRTLFMYDDARVTALAAAVRPDDPAVIVYTSGTTAHLKGAVLPHGRHIAAAANMLGHYPELARGPHRAVAFLPLSHVMGRAATITLPLLADVVPHYPEDVEGFADTLYEVAPTFLFMVPRASSRSSWRRFPRPTSRS